MEMLLAYIAMLNFLLSMIVVQTRRIKSILSPKLAARIVLLKVELMNKLNCMQTL